MKCNKQVFYLNIEQGARVIAQGGIIAYPTEAVFGLGCDPQNEVALQQLIMLKKRSVHKGVILIASDITQLLPYISISQIPKERWEIIKKTWPGPYTWVFPKGKLHVPLVSGQHQSIAVRVTAHPVAKALCEAFNGALVSTSANVSCAAPYKTAEQLQKYFNTQIDGVVEGCVGGSLAPSRIIDAVTDHVYR